MLFCAVFSRVLAGKKFASDGSLQCNDTRPFVWNDFFATAKTLEKALDFFIEDHGNVNLDGVLGLRLTEGKMHLHKMSNFCSQL